jgi:hypothetical protein
LVGGDYFLNLERIFEQDDPIVGLNAEIVADGVKSAGFTFAEGLRLVQQFQRRKIAPVTREIGRWYAA